MDIEEDGRILNLRSIRELNKATGTEFLAAVRFAAKARAHAIEVDLSELRTLDSAGLASLIGLRKAVDAKAWIEKPTIRLRHPQPVVQQLLELTRMHHLFEIVPAPVVGQASRPTGEAFVLNETSSALSAPKDRRDACATTAQTA